MAESCHTKSEFKMRNFIVRMWKFRYSDDKITRTTKGKHGMEQQNNDGAIFTPKHNNSKTIQRKVHIKNKKIKFNR